MATGISQHVRHLRRHLEFFKNFIFIKTVQQIFLKLVETCVYGHKYEYNLK